jgi:hypothetical protein
MAWGDKLTVASCIHLTDECENLINRETWLSIYCKPQADKGLKYLQNK